MRTRKAQDPDQFAILFNIIDEEVSRNDHNHSKSCTKGLLWLKRYGQQRAIKHTRVDLCQQHLDRKAVPACQ